MNKLYLVSVLFILIALIGPTSIVADQLDPAPRVYLSSLPGEVATEPAMVVERFNKLLLDRDLTFEERFDLGSALFILGRTDDASLVYRFALGVARNEAERGLALLAAAEGTWQQDPQRLARSEDEQREAFREAGRLANLAQLQVPDSVEIARFRYAYWTNAGDALEATVALDHGRRLDMSMDGVEVFDPGALVVIAVYGAVLVLSIVLERKGWITPDDRGEIIAALIYHLFLGP